MTFIELKFHPLIFSAFAPLSKSFQVMPAPPGKQEFHPVGSFDQFGLAEGALPPSLGPLHKLRLSLHSSSANWAILSEIFLKRAS